MRLTNAIRASVAGKVADEKMKTQSDLMNARLRKAANEYVKRVIPAEFFKAWEDLNRSEELFNVQTSLRVYVRDHGGYGSTRYIEGLDKYPEPHAFWKMKENVDCRELNQLLTENKKLEDKRREIYLEVLKFLKQFGSYKKLEAEWSDIRNYLSDADNPKTSKTGTALMKTGRDLTNFLANYGDC